MSSHTIFLIQKIVHNCIPNYCSIVPHIYPMLPKYNGQSIGTLNFFQSDSLNYFGFFLNYLLVYTEKLSEGSVTVKLFILALQYLGVFLIFFY